MWLATTIAVLLMFFLGGIGADEAWSQRRERAYERSKRHKDWLELRKRNENNRSGEADKRNKAAEMRELRQRSKEEHKASEKATPKGKPASYTGSKQAKSGNNQAVKPNLPQKSTTNNAKKSPRQTDSDQRGTVLVEKGDGSVMLQER